MFKKIVSQLSLSPSATSQLAFYARRLKQERITRTFSAVAAVLMVGLQFAVIVAPPTASNAASPNDIILGGFVSKNDLLNRFDQSAELQSLYKHMGISRADIENTHVANINSSDHSLKSIGRDQHDSNDVEIVVGSHQYWLRGLYVWDTGSNIKNGSTYQVLEGQRSADGGYFAVMFRCGNIVIKKQYVPPAPTPKPPTPIPTPKPTPVPTSPSIACSYLIATPTTGDRPLKVNFTGAGSANKQTIADYLFDFGDKTTLTQAAPTVSHTYTSSGTYTATLRVKGSLGTVSGTPPTCAVTIHPTLPPASFTKAKYAENLTQNIDATTKPANAGDLIKYHLTTKNIGAAAGSYVVVEHIEDILEYADVTDATGATVSADPNAAIASDSVLTWPAVTIQPGETLNTTFTVRIKDPIPATPVGISDKNSYDLRLDNVYGNTVEITLTPPVAKQVEIASQTLPDTGAPTGTIIVLVVSGLSLFFYLRNRQLLSEIRLLRGEYQGGL
jgi:PKD repeat protein